MFDVVIPIGMSVPEYLLFIAIDPKYSTQAASWGNMPWAIWYLWFSLHAFGAWALITNRLTQTVVEADYTLELRPLAQEHVNWMRE